MPWRSGSGATLRCGFTLIEVLTATALTLMLMAAVVTIFGSIGGSISDSRATLEVSDGLRNVATRLQLDLNGLTVTPIPPRDPADAEGYLEIIEGPRQVASLLAPSASDMDGAIDADPGTISDIDTTVGDNDDILMCTIQSRGQPFVGRFGRNGYIESRFAEVCWFVRGRTLYRRELLIVPGAPIDHAPAGFYARYDVSVKGGVRDDGSRWMGTNSLSDLTRRECRYAHAVHEQGRDSFPFHATGWGQLGLPTLRECCSPNWTAGSVQPIWAYSNDGIDYWRNPHPWPDVDPESGTLTQYDDGPARTDDVMLNNVIGFDVKLWDPLAQAYVDLGGPNAISFKHKKNRDALANGKRIYCTWSNHYKVDKPLSLFLAGMTDKGANGFDDNDNGAVDDYLERESLPPYAVPLRAIQVKIRVFEPDTRQIREVTVAGDFLPK